MGRWAQHHRDAAALETQRVKGVDLLAHGWSQRAVARQLGVTTAAVCQWKRAVDRGGRAALSAIPRSGRPPWISREAMTAFPRLLSREAIRYGISADLSTIPRIIRFVEAQWGVRYTQSAMSRLLRRSGLPRRRPRERAHGTPVPPKPGSLLVAPLR